jgi:hypothetical protein
MTLNWVGLRWSRWDLYLVRGGASFVSHLLMIELFDRILIPLFAILFTAHRGSPLDIWKNDGLKKLKTRSPSTNVEG